MLPWVACASGQRPAKAPAKVAVPAAQPFERTWDLPVNATGPLALAADATSLFLAGAPGTFVSRSAADGHVVWSEPLTSQTRPVVSDGLVFVVAEGRLHALDAASGSTRWPLGIAAGPVPPTARGGWLVVPSSSGVGAFRIADGSAIWQRALGASITVPVAIDGDRVFLALSDGRLVGLDLLSGDTIWTEWLSSAPAGLSAGNALVYFGGADGKVYAYSQDRGLCKWTYAIGAEAVDAPVADGARVYVAARDNTVWALDAARGNQRWRVPVEGRPAGSPWLDETSFAVALVTGEIDILDSKSGKASSKLPAPAPVTVIIDFPARLQGIVSPGLGRIVRLTLDPDQRGSTLAAFTRAKRPVK